MDRERVRQLTSGRQLRGGVECVPQGGSVLRPFSAVVFVAVLAHAQDQKPAAAMAEPTVVLEGRVVDLRGEGVPLAKVWVTAPGEPGRELAKSVCDGEGFFRIGQIPARASGMLRATGEGLCIGEAQSKAD